MLSCLLCHNLIGFRQEWCSSCHPLLPWNRFHCQRCAEPWEQGLHHEGSAFQGLCQRCVQDEPHFDRCFTPFVYRFPINQLILAGKSGHKPELLISLARAMAKLAARHPADRPALLVPIPLHPQRQRERGYNQAGLIAHVLGKKLRIPVAHTLLQKKKETPQQKGLSRSARQANLQRIYRVDREQLHGRYKGLHHIALVDDVITTASTLNQLAKQLRSAGVERVDGWALARTPSSSSS